MARTEEREQEGCDAEGEGSTIFHSVEFLPRLSCESVP